MRLDPPIPLYVSGFGPRAMALAGEHGDGIIFAIPPRGVPVAAILAGTAFGYAAVVMSYVSPGKVFAFLVNSYGTVAIFVYVLIAFSQLKLRRRLERAEADLETARRVIEVQGNVSALLGQLLEPRGAEGSTKR